MRYLVTSLQRLKWSVQAKLALAFACMLILFIFDGIISISLINQLTEGQQEQVTIAKNLDNLQRFEAAFQNEQNLYNQIIFVSKVTLVIDPNADVIVEQLSQNKTTTQPEQLEFGKKLASLYGTVQTDFIGMGSSIKSANFEKAQQQWLAATSSFQALQSFIDDRRQQLTNTQISQEQTFADNSVLAFGLVVGITLLSVVLALLFLLLIQKALLSPLQQLKQSLEEMAQGELNQHLEIINRDEIGRLAQSFTAALSSVQKIVRGVKISQELEAVAKQLNTVNSLQIDGVSQQASAITQVSAAVEELGHTATQIAASAARVEEVVNVTIQQVKELEQRGDLNQQQVATMVKVVEETLVGIERVEDQVLSISQKMVDFNEQFGLIIRVVDLLENLASEVHLLSLNAAIEAAGAGGETGGRFKSVAGAVRNLAAKARAATLEANQLITQMQQGSQTVSSQVEAGRSEVTSLANANNGLRYDLQQMQQNTNELALATKQLLLQAQDVNNEAIAIKTATYQQQINNTQIIASIHSVQQVTHETASMGSQVTASSDQLEFLSVQLNKVLNQIKLAT